MTDSDDLTGTDDGIHFSLEMFLADRWMVDKQCQQKSGFYLKLIGRTTYVKRNFSPDELSRFHIQSGRKLKFIGILFLSILKSNV